MNLRNRNKESYSGNAETVALILCIATLFLIASLFILNVDMFIFSGQFPEYQYGFGSGQSDFIGTEVCDGVQVQQTIPIERTVDRVALRVFSADKKNLKGTQITVTGVDSGKVYLDTKMDEGEQQEDGRYCFVFDEDAEVSADRSIRVSVCSSLPEAAGFYFGVSRNNTLVDGDLFIDGAYQDYDLDMLACGTGVISEGEIKSAAISTTVMAVAAGLICLFVYWLTARYYRFRADFVGIALWGLLMCVSFFAERYLTRDGGFVPYRFSFFLGILSILLLFFRFRSTLWSKPECLFLLAALFVGLRLTMIPYTCVAWDDETHFFRAARLSHSLGAQISCADTAMGHCRYQHFAHSAKNIGSVLADLRDLWMMGKMPVAVGEAGSLPFLENLAYLPAVVGLTLGRALGLPYVDTFFLGKILNVLVYILAVYYAIKIVPVGKRIMLVVALFPTNLFLASNYAYDAWTTGLTMLWIAMLLDEMNHLERGISNRRLASMLAVFALSCSSKAIYCSLGLLFFLMPKQKAGTAKEKRRYYFSVCLVMALLLLSFTLPFLLNTGSQSDMRGGSSVNSGEQLKFIFTHPITYTKILLRHLGSYLSLDSTIQYMTFFAYLGISSNLPLLVLTAIVTVTDRNDISDRIVKPWKNRLLVYACAFATVCLISTALYISFTPVGSGQINGCQLRYLLPLVFPCLLFASTSWAPVKIRPEKYNAWVFLASTAIVLSTEWNCYLAGFPI